MWDLKHFSGQANKVTASLCTGTAIVQVDAVADTSGGAVVNKAVPGPSMGPEGRRIHWSCQTKMARKIAAATASETSPHLIHRSHSAAWRPWRLPKSKKKTHSFHFQYRPLCFQQMCTQTTETKQTTRSSTSLAGSTETQFQPNSQPQHSFRCDVSKQKAETYESGGDASMNENRDSPVLEFLSEKNNVIIVKITS